MVNLPCLPVTKASETVRKQILRLNRTETLWCSQMIVSGFVAVAWRTVLRIRISVSHLPVTVLFWVSCNSRDENFTNFTCVHSEIWYFWGTKSTGNAQNCCQQAVLHLPPFGHKAASFFPLRHECWCVQISFRKVRRRTETTRGSGNWHYRIFHFWPAFLTPQFKILQVFQDFYRDKC